MATHDVTVEPDAISGYVGGLRQMLQWRTDVDDIVAEIEDHLRESAERLVDRGTDRAAADGLAVACLGEPSVVARSFVATPSGGVAVPTRVTRALGGVALVAPALWALAAITGLFAADLIVAWQDTYQVWWSLSTLVAATASTLATAGLLLRAGARNAVAAIALSTMVFGIAMLGIAPWMWMAGAGLMAIGSLMALRQVRAGGLRVHTVDWLMVVGAPAATAVFAMLDRLHIGRMDSYGDYPVASFAGFAIIACSISLAVGRVGLWLRSEQPADRIDKTAPVDEPALR